MKDPVKALAYMACAAVVALGVVVTVALVDSFSRPTGLSVSALIAAAAVALSGVAVYLISYDVINAWANEDADEDADEEEDKR